MDLRNYNTARLLYVGTVLFPCSPMGSIVYSVAMELVSIVDWVSIVTGVGGLVTGSISLTISLREKRRNVKVVLKWGIDTTYQKTSGIVLWIYTVNGGYQPVVIHNAGLHVTGLASPLIAAKPLSNNQFPLRLEPGDQYSTSFSSEV